MGFTGRKSGPEQTRILLGFTDGACGGAYGEPRHYYFSAETFGPRWVSLRHIALGYCTLCGLYAYVLLVITSHYLAFVALSSDMRVYGTLADLTRPVESDMRVYVTLADMTPDA
ncbi:hypothetical protein LXL04_034555 [Taraxacum kok-saghyz]